MSARHFAELQRLGVRTITTAQAAAACRVSVSAATKMLRELASAGLVESLRHGLWLLDHGAKVNQPGWSPLHYAATGPEPKVVQLLIERGADLNALSPNGTTPLMMAAQYGSEGSVDLLLARGADRSLRNDKGLRAADFARLSGREALVRRLAQAPPR